MSEHVERSLQRCIEHVRTRRQFGKPIGAFQSVSNRIVDIDRVGTRRAIVEGKLERAFAQAPGCSS